jgi:hypothetical protein
LVFADFFTHDGTSPLPLPTVNVEELARLIEEEESNDKLD